MLRGSTSLVATSSSEPPPPDEIRVRWRRRPVLAFVVRAVAVGLPLAASVLAGLVASRAFRPDDAFGLVLWIVWTASVSLLVLWLVDLFSRRLLPLHRLLQLCLAFPDRAPSRLKVAVRAARSHRPEALVERDDAPTDAAAVATQIVTMLAALAHHDRRTRGHSERVCAYTSLLAEQMHLTTEDRDRLMWAALVHDIGKLHVPVRVLNKPARPTLSEWELLMQHPERGADITAPLRDWLGPWADAVLQHHERYDGAGYPHGLRGEEICLAARMIAVTDAFEVMTAPRAYRRPVDAQTARAELARHAGDQFDPEIVRHFLAVGLPELRRAMGPLAWLAEIPFVSSWPRLESAATASATQAATVAAAASTAGILALGGGGATPAAADEHAPVVSAQDQVVPAPPILGLVTAPLGGAPASSASTSPAAPATNVHASRSTARHSHHGHHRGRPAADAGPASEQPVAGPEDPVASSETCPTGRAAGHERASGWLRNWGPGGRRPGHEHASDDRAVDNADCS